MKRGNLFWIILSVVIALVAGTALESKVGFWKKEKATRAELIKNNKDSLAARWSNDFDVVDIRSPIDGAIQKAYFLKTRSSTPKPLVVSLHSWSFDYRQDDTLALLSKAKDINYIHPDFRG